MRDGAASGADGSHKVRKKALRERILGRALGMPLDADDPIAVALPFETFDNAIRGLGSDA